LFSLVDRLTDDLKDLVDVLQLGGGTDIDQASACGRPGLSSRRRCTGC
jgi:hypothetical protein